MINLNLNLLFGSYYGTALIGRQYAGSAGTSAAGRLTTAPEPASEKIRAIGDDDCREVYDVSGEDGTVTRLKPAPKSLTGPGEYASAEEPSTERTEAERVEDRFRSRLEDRLQRPGAGIDSADAAVIAERLKSAAVEIGGALGQAKANQFMNKVLSAASAAEAGDQSDPVGAAVESIFSQLAATSKESPAAYQRLAEIKKNLNRTANLGLDDGLEAAPAEVEGPPPSPAKASLNRRFSAGRPEGSGPDAARALGNLVNSFI